MMNNSIRMLCALSAFCGVALSLSPAGKGKRVMSFVCSVVLLAGVVNLLREPDWESYALEAARLKQREEAFLESSTEIVRQLDRRVIEEKCESYILDRARQKQLPLQEAGIVAQWSMEGIWIPFEAKLKGNLSSGQREEIAGMIESELGIPRSRQEWRENGG